MLYVLHIQVYNSIQKIYMHVSLCSFLTVDKLMLFARLRVFVYVEQICWPLLKLWFVNQYNECCLISCLNTESLTHFVRIDTILRYAYAVKMCCWSFFPIATFCHTFVIWQIGNYLVEWYNWCWLTYSQNSHICMIK